MKPVGAKGVSGTDNRRKSIDRRTVGIPLGKAVAPGDVDHLMSGYSLTHAALLGDPLCCNRMRSSAWLSKSTHLQMRSVMSRTSRSFVCGGCAPPAAAAFPLSRTKPRVRLSGRKGRGRGEQAHAAGTSLPSPANRGEAT